MRFRGRRRDHRGLEGRDSGLTGVDALTQNGDLYIKTGDIVSATSGGGGYNAWGIDAGAQGNLAIYAGNVVAHSAAGAYGVKAKTYGAGHDIYVVNVSSVTAVSGMAPGNAVGVDANDRPGSIEIRSSGAISASGAGYADGDQGRRLRLATSTSTWATCMRSAPGTMPRASMPRRPGRATFNVSTGGVHVGRQHDGLRHRARRRQPG